MTPHHCLYVHLHSGRLASEGDCPETALANWVRFLLSPTGKVDIPVLLPILMNLTSLLFGKSKLV